MEMDLFPDDCLKCKRTIRPYVIKFNICNHQFCPSCFSFDFFKSPLNNLTIDSNRELILSCPCNKGKVTLGLDQVISYLSKNQIQAPLCDNHNEACISYCSKCKIWLCPQCLSLFHNAYFTNHPMSLVPLSTTDLLCTEHNKRLKVKCLKCNVDICSTCLIENHTQHKVITHKDIIKSKLKFASFNDYDDYLTQREIQLKDELYFINKEIINKIESAIEHLTVLKSKVKEQYASNCKFITSLNTFNRKLYYFLYEKIASNDPGINPLLGMYGKEGGAYIDIGLMHFSQIEYDYLMNLSEKMIDTRVDAKIQLVRLQYNCKKTFNTWKNERVNAICEVKNNLIALATITKGLELIDVSEYNKVRHNIIDAHTDCITELLSRHKGDLITCSLDCLIKIWQIDAIDNAQLVKSLSGHKDGINTMIYISNKRLASGAKDNNIKLWDLIEMKYIRTMSSHKKEINCIVSVNKAKIATSSLDLNLCFWDVDKGTCDLVIPMTKGLITSMFIWGDSLYLAMEKDNMIYKWTIGQTKIEAGILKHEGLITKSVILLNYTIATSSLDQTICIWDLKKEPQFIGHLIGHCAPVYALTQLLDGRIVSGSRDGIMKIWEYI